MRSMKFKKTSCFMFIFATTALAGEPVLTASPRELRGLPGEPLRVELTVVTPDAQPVRLSVPSASNLVVRTVERIPVQRTSDGRFVQKYTVLWQGTASGSITLTNLTAVFRDKKAVFPAIGITIDAVDPAAPPRSGEPQ